MAGWTKRRWAAIAGGLWLLIPCAGLAGAQTPSPEPSPEPAANTAPAQGAAAPETADTAAPGEDAPGEDAPIGNRTARADDARLLAFQKLQPRVKRPSDIPAAARLELRVHARRMARLARIRSLAEYANDRTTVQRADRISERERTRHQQALARVWPALSDPKAATRPSDEAEPRVPEDEEEQEPEP